MQETLYKTSTPESFISEYYEIAVLNRPGDHSAYMFIELHGWWDDGDKQPKNQFTTICPEEGLTWEEAEQMYKNQRDHRARSGFIYSFSKNPFGDGGRVIQIGVD